MARVVGGVMAALLVILVGAGSALCQHYYKWVDENGVVHFTDNLGAVPEIYRNQIEEKRFGGTGAERGGVVSGRKIGKEAAESPADSVVVNFQKQGSYILVNGVINYHYPAVFYLDTGASLTMITKEDAEALGIDLLSAKEVPTRLADGRRVVLPVVVLDSLRVGDAEVKNVEAAVSNVRLLGLSYLKHFRVTIDNISGQLHLERIKKGREKESESARMDRLKYLRELEAKIKKFRLAVEDLEKSIKQREITIRLLERRKREIEREIGELAKEPTGRKRTMYILQDRERLEKINLAIEREKVAIEHHRKDIEMLKDNITYYEKLKARLK